MVMAVVVLDKSWLRLAEWIYRPYMKPMRLAVFSGSAACGLMSTNSTASLGNCRALLLDAMDFQYSFSVADSPSTGIVLKGSSSIGYIVSYIAYIDSLTLRLRNILSVPNTRPGVVCRPSELRWFSVNICLPLQELCLAKFSWSSCRRCIEDSTNRHAFQLLSCCCNI